ncbi:VQ motif-containing protein 10-like [Phoenix dactylifera]|uniref:VQ motif-containing protein 10-like n=1 Tax=Phoenix dactylifera TaxID=42345 RepID=A0A8B8ZR09_PHODC|nr:VQ motif-containing protein 10-like [Phoenix dactylifera]
MSRKGVEAAGVRVTVIETKFVKTDAAHFKSVVQSLTGKDSTVTAVVPERPRAIRGTVKLVEEINCGWRGGRQEELAQETMVVDKFEEMVAVEPCLEELYQLWTY